MADVDHLGLAFICTSIRTQLCTWTRTPTAGFTPHDFRRLLATDLVNNGLPIHIGAALLGHLNLETTGAVYPEEVINGHRAFIARRRALRPSDEYRTPTDAEWEEFVGHFERRRVALGDCGRAYGTSCIHEHSCFSLLRPDPAQRSHLAGIRSNLQDRITEAQQHRWAGEAEGLKVSLAAATAKLTQMDELAARRATAVHLGMPAFTQTASRTIIAATVLPTASKPDHRPGISAAKSNKSNT